jgi:hypothetical protein
MTQGNEQCTAALVLLSFRVPMRLGDGPQVAGNIATRLLLAEAGGWSLVYQEAHHSTARTSSAGTLLAI